MLLGDGLASGLYHCATSVALAEYLGMNWTLFLCADLQPCHHSSITQAICFLLIACVSILLLKDDARLWASWNKGICMVSTPTVRKSLALST